MLAQFRQERLGELDQRVLRGISEMNASACIRQKELGVPCHIGQWLLN